MTGRIRGGETLAGLLAPAVLAVLGACAPHAPPSAPASAVAGTRALPTVLPDGDALSWTSLLVRDAATGAPIAGAVCAVQPSGRSVETDPRGVADLAGLAAGAVVLRVAATGYEERELTTLTRACAWTTLVADLDGTTALEGTVRLTDGRPAAGAVVRVDLAAGHRDARADGEGRYRIDRLPPVGTAAVDADDAGASHTHRRVALVPGEANRADLSLERAQRRTLSLRLAPPGAREEAADAALRVNVASPDAIHHAAPVAVRQGVVTLVLRDAGAAPLDVVAAPLWGPSATARLAPDACGADLSAAIDWRRVRVDADGVPVRDTAVRATCGDRSVELRTDASGHAWLPAGRGTAPAAGVSFAAADGSLRGARTASEMRDGVVIDLLPHERRVEIDWDGAPDGGAGWTVLAPAAPGGALAPLVRPAEVRLPFGTERLHVNGIPLSADLTEGGEGPRRVSLRDEFDAGSVEVVVPSAATVELCAGDDLTHVEARRIAPGAGRVEFPRVPGGAHWVSILTAHGDLLLRRAKVAAGRLTRVQADAPELCADDVRVVVEGVAVPAPDGLKANFRPIVPGARSRDHVLPLAGDDAFTVTCPGGQPATISLPSARVSWAIDPGRLRATAVLRAPRDADATPLAMPQELRGRGVDQMLALSADGEGILRLEEIAPSGAGEFLVPRRAAGGFLLASAASGLSYLRLRAEDGRAEMAAYQDREVRIPRTDLPARAVAFYVVPVELGDRDVRAFAIRGTRRPLGGDATVSVSVPDTGRFRLSVLGPDGIEVASRDLP